MIGKPECRCPNRLSAEQLKIYPTHTALYESPLLQVTKLALERASAALVQISLPKNIEDAKNLMRTAAGTGNLPVGHVVTSSVRRPIVQFDAIRAERFEDSEGPSTVDHAVELTNDKRAITDWDFGVVRGIGQQVMARWNMYDSRDSVTLLTRTWHPVSYEPCANWAEVSDTNQAATPEGLAAIRDLWAIGTHIVAAQSAQR